MKKERKNERTKERKKERKERNTKRKIESEGRLHIEGGSCLEKERYRWWEITR